jgi:Right handed beta helix region
MLRLKRALGACMLATTLLPSVATYAATYYVATTGNNSSPGTSSQPWRTVAYAVDRMVAGDTTYVKSGVYNEGLIRFKRSGTQSAPIKLLNAPGAFPVIDCIDRTKAQMVLLQNSSGFKYPIGWITVEGFEIRDCYNGIKWYNLHDSVIRRNWVHDAHSGSGILGAGSLRVHLDRNRVNRNAITDTTGTGGHGVYINGSNVTLTNNLIYDNRGHGIQLNGTAAYDSSKFAGVGYAESHNWIISNNTLAYSRQESGLVIWGSRCNNTRVENNIFYENANAGTSLHANGVKFVSTSCTGIKINNNIAFASGSGGTRFLTGTSAKEGVHFTQSSNIVNTVNPKFVNAPATMPSSPNFALVSGSPAIDRGLSISTTKISYPGTTRPQLSAFDVGAYEYYSNGTALTAPTSLQTAN